MASDGNTNNASYDAVDNGNDAGNSPENLYSKFIKSEGKVFYLDVRENGRGQFLKLTEKRHNTRHTLVISSNALTSIVATLDKAMGEETVIPDEMKESEEINWVTIDTKSEFSMGKRLYIDIMLNKYGRSLNIAEISKVRGKSAVIVSEKTWGEFRDALAEIKEQFPEFARTPSANYQPPPTRSAPKEPKEQQQQESNTTVLLTKKLDDLKGKTVFLDFIENDNGRALKISELKNKKRSTLHIPDVCYEPIAKLMEVLQGKDFNGEVEGMELVDVENSDEGNSTTLMKRVMELEGTPPSPNRTYTLELRENEHGKFIKMSEQKPENRMRSVFLPENAFDQVKQAIEEYNNL